MLFLNFFVNACLLWTTGLQLLLLSSGKISSVSAEDAPPQPLQEVKFYNLPSVVKLNDKNFEHETQASTGGTTGSWLIYFHKSRDDTLIYGAVPDNDVLAEHHIVLGAANIKYNVNVWERMRVRGLPAFIYLHKGKLYRYQKPAMGGFTWKGLLQFCFEDVPNNVYEGEPIPSPMTAFSRLMELVRSIQKDGGRFFGGILLVFSILGAAALAGQKKKEKSKTA
jgi:hypothetical protein